jgi:hypothetical protein
MSAEKFLVTGATGRLGATRSNVFWRRGMQCAHSGPQGARAFRGATGHGPYRSVERGLRYGGPNCCLRELPASATAAKGRIW